MTLSSEIKKRLMELPDRPGVYVMRDRLGQVIYVGKARSLKKRVRSYFQPSRLQKIDPKTRSLINQVTTFETYEVRSEPEALLLEGKLIKELRPRYNISFRDDKRFLMVKVRMQDPFPRFELARIKKDDGARYFGPFAHSGSLRNTIDFITRQFGLRSCRAVYPGEEDYRHCMDDIIRHCSAPCIGKVDAEEYRERVEAACEFLEGRNKALLGKLEAEMLEAAERQEFEKAAQIRDSLSDLRRTVGLRTRKFSRDHFPRSYDGLEAVRQLQTDLGLPRVPHRIEGFDISNISGTLAVASMVSFENGKPNKAAYRRFRIKTVTDGPDDFRMMAEAVGRRYSRLLREGASLPDLILIDGGKGQLNAARRRLWGMGLEDVPILGLAKKNEEVFVPDRKDPILIERSSSALRLLQQLRDEAHRFALTYHRDLRRKRIRNSVLDDLPGLGSKRKGLLLEHFGSVEQMRAATERQLCQVPGIGPKLAEQIRRHLSAKKEGGPASA
jgi:excinuclease ABC subunit C